jgi:hypothetical protein
MMIGSRFSTSDFRSTFFTLFALVFTLLLTTAAKPAYSQVITREGYTASITFPVGYPGGQTVYLASYQAVGEYSGVIPTPEQLKAQVLYDIDLAVLPAGPLAVQVTLTVNLPPCENSQVDAFRSRDGRVIMSFTGDSAQYRDDFIAGVVYLLADEPCRDEPGRMTGGGSVFAADGMRVTHGFELHCDADAAPQRLEVNFNGNRFHLESVTTMFCYPLTVNGVTTYHLFGVGTGRLNGVSGAEISFHFTDSGEPGKDTDVADYIIQDSSGIVMMVDGDHGKHLLNSGNQQWHKENKK